VNLFQDRRHVAVIGLGYGDESKGATVDVLTRDFDYGIVVKSSGATQCAHHVTRGRHTHRFAQFGSGTFNGAMTILSKYFMVDPLRLLSEFWALDKLKDEGVVPADEDLWDLLMVDRRCLITTPIHAAANRAREIARGSGAHGSCGVGVGETQAYELTTGNGLRVFHLDNRDQVEWLLREMVDHYADALGQPFWDAFTELNPHSIMAPAKSWLPDIVDSYMAFMGNIGGGHKPDDIDSTIQSNAVVFEGSQGVLLDEWYGFHPYTTWSTTTFENADKLGHSQDVYHLGCIRSYHTRHGAGPFPTEVPGLKLDEKHNGTGRFQGAWRAGHFDAVLMRYALEVCGRVDGLAVSHIDKFQPLYCDSYGLDPGLTHLAVKPPEAREDLERQVGLTEHLERVKARGYVNCKPWPDVDPKTAFEKLFDVPVVITSDGPRAKDRTFHV
jgi:adenylosuccinate synthase